MTPRPAASAVPAPEPAASLPPTVTQTLTEAIAQLPQVGVLTAAIAADIPPGTEAREARAIAVRHLATARATANAVLASGLRV